MNNIPIQVDPNGFLWYDGVKLPVRFIRERGTLEFFDKDRRRSDLRGSRVLEIPVNQFERDLLGRAEDEKVIPFTE